MNTLESNIFRILAGIVLAATLFLSVVHADGHEVNADKQREVAEEAYRMKRAAGLAAIEQLRLQAKRAAEQARATAEALRAETERLRAEEEQAARELGHIPRERATEIEQARRELSHTHRELQRASRDVAKAHRDLAMAEDQRLRARLVNLGDRPMMGVILGPRTADGIKIIGLSPDGPAERAGLKTGDILTSLRGQSLVGEGPAAEAVYEVLNDVAEGEEIRVEVLRNGKPLDFMLKPERREPASWASYIRLPEPPAVVADVPDAADFPPPHIVVEQIMIPPIDAAELAARAEAMAEQFEVFRAVTSDGENWTVEMDGDFKEFAFDSATLAELSERALGEANIWLGAPASLGIRFARLNEGLGRYFGAEHGVLVLEAAADNPLQLQPGDVVLSIGEDSISETSDVVRALRGYEAGDAVRIAIKRDQRDESLNVVMPDNRFGP